MRMLKNSIIWVLLMLAGNCVWGQGSVRVVVTDKDNNQPVFLAYVNVYSANNNAVLLTEQTDELGIATVKPEEYPCRIEIVSAGYGSFSKEFLTLPLNPQISVSLIRKFNSLNEVVITGLNRPEKMKNALSLYQVVPKAIIDAQGAVTLDEALKNQMNIRLRSDNILGTSIGMQGMTGNKVKVLIDGIPVNGREGGNINLSQINMNNVDHIEMIQGPMSVVYGSDALGGIINVITKKQNKPLALFANTHLESVGKYNFDGGITFKAGKKSQVTIGGGRNYFQGWKYIDVPVSYSGDTLRTERSLYFKPSEQYIGNAAYSYNATSGFKLNIASDYLNEKITNRGSISVWEPFRAYAFDEYYRTKRYMNRLSMEGALGKTGHWQSQNGYNVYDRTRTRVTKNMVTLQEVPTSGKGDQDTSLFQDVNMRSSYANKWNKLTYTVGYDIALQYAHSLKISGNTKDIGDYALYANVTLPLIESKLTVQAGGRASANSTYKPPVIPNINLMFTPFQKMQLRASYTQGFRAPALKEMYLSFIDNNHNIIGNADLKAESSTHIQSSVSYQLYEEQANYLQLIFTGFYNDVKDGIVLVPTHPEDTNSIDYKYGNLSRQSNTIATLSVDGQWNDFHAKVGYSNNHTFEQSGQYNAFNAGEATATLQYNWRKPGINFNVFYKYTGTQPFLLASVDGSATYSGTQQAYHTCDASLDHSFFNKKLQVIIGAKNIFDLQLLQVSGISTSSAHSGGSGYLYLPRTFFTTLKLNID
jgi:outer membrane receptor for ferrienterochelin and colicins